MLATTKQVRKVLRNLGCGGDSWTDKCANDTMRLVAYCVGYDWDEDKRKALQKRVADAMFLAGFANKVKVTQSPYGLREGGCVYVRVKAAYTN